VGDWKDNKKEGYGIIVYDNKDKYEVIPRINLGILEKRYEE
jgi:hypothetical protein